MEVKAKMKDAANAVAASKIEAKQIAAKVEELAKKASKQLRIDGFRQGKVPTAVVLKRYGKQLEGDAKQELLKDMIDQSLKILKMKFYPNPFFLNLTKTKATSTSRSKFLSDRRLASRDTRS